jgi:hypothetical protein
MTPRERKNERKKIFTNYSELSKLGSKEKYSALSEYRSKYKKNIIYAEVLEY